MDAHGLLQNLAASGLAESSPGMGAQGLLQNLAASGLDESSPGMDAQGLLQNLADLDGSEGDAASGHGEGSQGEIQERLPLRRRRRVCRFLCVHMRRSKADRVAMRQLRAQALHNRRLGGARTHDHVMMAGVRRNMVPDRLRRGSRKTGRGRGAKWKTHTPEAICKAVFNNLHASFKSNAVDGSCKSHVLKCSWAVARIIHNAVRQTNENLKRPLAEGVVSGSEAPAIDDFHINNNMFDETELWLKCGDKTNAKKRRRVLGIASQVTRRAPGGTTEDLDVLKPPVKMRRYTAATVANILGQPDDCTGLCPEGPAAPKAKYVASLTAFDSHSVNKLVSKWVRAKQKRPAQRCFHVASYCTQHMTGNVVELVSKYLGVIRPGYALASCLATGAISDSLDCELFAVLEKDLEVVDPTALELDAPPAWQQHELLRVLFEQCYVQASGRGDDQERKQRAETEEILSFLQHQMASACGTRARVAVAIHSQLCQQLIGARRLSGPMAWLSVLSIHAFRSRPPTSILKSTQ